MYSPGAKRKNIFPNEDPVGKLVALGNDKKFPFTVGGVIEDHPGNSHFQFDFLITLQDKEFWKGEQTSWGSVNYNTYVSLNDGVDPHTFQAKVGNDVLDKYILPMLIEEGVPDPKALLSKYHLELQPVTKIYITSDVRDGLPHGDAKTIWFFG